MMRMTRRKICQSDKDNNPKNPYISLPETCKRLYMTESSVRYHINAGRLKAFKSGGKWWICEADVSNWVNIQKATGRIPPAENGIKT